MFQETNNFLLFKLFLIALSLLSIFNVVRLKADKFSDGLSLATLERSSRNVTPNCK